MLIYLVLFGLFVDGCFVRTCKKYEELELSTLLEEEEENPQQLKNNKSEEHFAS